MKIRYPYEPHPSTREALEIALTLVSDMLIMHGGEGKRFQQDFAAITIAIKRPEGKGELTWQNFLQTAISCEAWVGNESAYSAAYFDDMTNARAKCFTAWRVGKDNGQVLEHSRHLLVAEDSVWPGAASEPDFGAVGTSGLEPREDESVSRFIIKTINLLFDLEVGRGCYKLFYPTDGKDTVGGLNFNYPPDWTDWE